MPLDFGFLLISFKKTFFPKIWAAKFRVWLICGCSLSTDAAYLQSLRYQPSLKNKKTKTLSDKGLTLIMSAFKTCYGGQFTWSTQLMKSNYLVSHPTNAAPQVLQECTSIIIIFIYLLAYYLHTIIISFINVLMLFRFYYYTSIFLQENTLNYNADNIVCLKDLMDLLQDSERSQDSLLLAITQLLVVLGIMLIFSIWNLFWIRKCKSLLVSHWWYLEKLWIYK